MMRKITFIALLAIGGCCRGGCSDCGGLPPKQERVPDPGRDRAAIRPCRADALVLDLALAVVPTPRQISDANFKANVRGLSAALEARIQNTWFEEAASLGNVGPVVRSVLPAKSYTARRRDGHQRFLRITFEDETGEPRRLSLLGQCEATKALREVRGMYGFGDYYVSRECELSAQSTWPLQSLGATDRTATNTTAAAEPSSRLVLLDTPIAPPIAQALAIEQIGSDLISEARPRTGLRNLHGSGMAILARQLTRAEMWSYAVLNNEGAGTPSTVARGLDVVLERLGANGPADLPTVINLSLGWSVQLEEESILRVPPQCETTEDPVGEPVRYVLDLIRDRDKSIPTAVVAAAGNQSLPTPSGIFEAAPAGVGTTVPTPLRVKPKADAHDGGVYPGAYTRDLTKRAGGAASLALGVGAIDARGRPARTERRTAPAVLYAPGQHVVVTWGSRLGSGPTPDACTPKRAHVDAEFPKSFTGSSVASALTAATAAEVQGLRVETEKSPFSFGVLSRFLVQTGRSCATKLGFDNAELSFVNATAVAKAMNSAATCQAFEACLITTTFKAAGGIADDPAFVRCAPQRNDCLADALSAGALDCTADRGLPSFPTSSCPSTNLGAPPIRKCTPSSPCPEAAGGDVALLGPVGPQPWDGSCSWCEGQVQNAGTEIEMLLDLYPPLTDGTPAQGTLRIKGRGIACASNIDASVSIGQVTGGRVGLTLEAQDIASCASGVQPKFGPSIDVDLIIEGTLDGVPYSEVTPLYVEEL